MGMVVQHNMNALNAYNKLNANVAGLKKASEKLSSGYRINRAGDDAAGLAISEKMRSQIRGLNQAKRNAQDGISMIQTFEGAAQETHTILQRMKELATESANGTYDNATDRAAIQLEFDQLNDELNQLADTDFNGTIVLNGGEMADGTVAKVKNPGTSAEVMEFDYKLAAEEKAAAEAKAKANEPIDLVAKSDYSGKAPDLQDQVYVNGPTKYVASVAAGSAKLWNQATDTDKYEAAKKLDEIYVKYEVSKVNDDGTIQEWTGKYVDKNGKDTGFKYTGTIAKTANGGFSDSVTGINVVTDMIGGKEGDFVTVKYTRPPEQVAPTNAGFGDSYKDGKNELKVELPSTNALTSLTDAAASKTTVTIEANVGTLWTDDTAANAAKKASVQEAIKYLDGAEISITFKGENNETAITPDIAGGAVKLTYTDKDGVLQEDTTLSESDEDTTGFGIKTGANGTGFIITYNNEDIAKVSYNVLGDGTANHTGTIVGTMHFDGMRYDSGEKPNASFVKGPAAVEQESKDVSKSNAFEHSTARLTYTDNITLQVGPRSKDAVNFTFNYNTSKTADMGDLKNNIDLSSREDGLNTANLKLSTPDDANYAIDQIDKAINKVSMVRASFGAIQNRLDYKIENLTTTSENLTEAESNIRDTDMANEMLNYTKFNILQQAAQSMLAQANQQPQSILQLLG